jgi:NTP pyrophosphatase (non-canonical NTP hydrolase)
MTGHDLAAALIRKHGVDRYPDIHSQLLKVVEELGELTSALLSGSPREEVLKEYADTGLALYALGNKLRLDLDKAMTDVVLGETRVFT